MAKTTVEILTEARDIVAAGWTQNSYESICDGNTCHCAMGGLYAAANGHKPAFEYGFEGVEPILHTRDTPEVKNATFWLVQAIKETQSKQFQHYATSYPGIVIVFNDDNSTEQQQVLDIFDRAILLATADKVADCVTQHEAEASGKKDNI